MHFKKMAEVMGTVLTRGRRLFRKRWWQVDPKFVFDQIAAPVLEIMDGSLYIQKKLDIHASSGLEPTISVFERAKEDI
jgi:hypothetical protein